MKAIILDTETTGLDAPEVVEVAWLGVDVYGFALADDQFVSRYRPSKPITLGALATHGIMDEDLVDAPPSSSFRLPEGVEYLIGYNVDFDWRAIGEPQVKRIDVCAMCRSLWPEADSYSQGAMLYLLNRREARARLRDAHSALADVLNCRIVLWHVIEKAGMFVSFEEMWRASERMRVPTVMPFGKHKGVAMKDVPRDYKQWMLKQPDVDPYLREALTARA